MDRDSLLKDHFLQKPECVIGLPEWMLPTRKVEVYRALSAAPILEIAGATVSPRQSISPGKRALPT
jgi:hypothetical protein